MKIFYHKDADGLVSAAVADYWFRKAGFNKPREYIPIVYTDTFPIDTIEKDENILIVDFSIKPEEMKELLKVTRNVQWVDHHKTAINLYDKFKDTDKIGGLRSTERSGAYLTWQFLAPNEKVPQFVELIDDHDRWVEAFEESHAVAKAIVVLTQFDPENPLIWDGLMEDNMEMLNQVIDAGNILETQSDMYRREAKGYRLEFEGFTFLVMNKIGNSQNFQYIDDGSYDGLMAWTFDGEGYSYTLYHGRRGKKDGIDLSEIAVKYGGGGHPGACGFYSKEFLADPRN